MTATPTRLSPTPKDWIRLSRSCRTNRASSTVTTG